ncbi:hypothetical protein EDS67_18705 [candidate division KSB1 bacterium]|nr:MAG: hypothetical protein EDS67_18705 [candidate division KSB1 bacterium]MCE7944454.1 hypothetical protein [Chlorobi bacterium CHB1]MDL1878464.1 hypothetical protein [Cytophagia bacterium CHB2]
MKANSHLFRIISLCAFLSYCDHGMNTLPEPAPGPEPEPELVCEPGQEELMPLDVGTYWFYQAWTPSTPETLKAEITRKVPVIIDGVTYEASALTPLYPFNRARPPFEFLYWNGPCGLYWLGGVSPTDTLFYKTLLFKYPAEVGESWTTIRINYDPVFCKFYFFDTLTVSLTRNYEMIDVGGHDNSPTFLP